MLPSPTSQSLVIKTGRVFDYDAIPAETSMQFTVTVSDGSTTVVSGNIQVAINNINDNPVVCSSTDYYQTISESAVAGKS